MQEGNNLQKALSDKSKIQDKVEQKALIIGQVISPFSYKPKIQGCFSKTYQFDYINQEFNENIQKTYPKEKRKIIISESFIQNEEQLNKKVLELSQYLIQINEKRLEVDYGDAESLIEQDFISLDK